MNRRSTLAALLAVLGCEGVEPDGVDFEWRGDYVIVEGHDRLAEQACGRSLRATDDSVRTMLEFHESNASVGIRYHWLSRSRWNELGLAADGRARHSQGEIVSLELAHDHELAHAVSWSIHGRTCAPVLEEGLAVVLEHASPDWSESLDLGRPIEELLTSKTLDSYGDYERAGHFVAFLLETHDVGEVQRLCESLPDERTLGLSDWDTALRSELGRPLADLLDAYADYPACNHHQYRLRLTDCAGPPDLVVGPAEPSAFSFRFACDQPEVIGETGGTMMRIVRVAVDEPGYYEVHVDDGATPQKVVVIHEQCASCSQVPLTGRIESGDLFSEDNPCIWAESPSECGYQPLSGMHAFVFFLDEGLDREIEVTITPQVLVGT